MDTKLVETKITQALDEVPLEAVPVGFVSETMRRVRQVEYEKNYRRQGRFVSWLVPAFLIGFSGGLVFTVIVLFNLRNQILTEHAMMQVNTWLLRLEPLYPILSIVGGVLLGLLIIGLIAGLVYWVGQNSRDPYYQIYKTANRRN